jgi:xanthine dehydrogenase accessory factor
MKEFSIWKFIHEQINKNGRVMLVSVLETHGSSPGKAGFKLAVGNKGIISGTIGGGEMELRIIKQCQKYLSLKKKIYLLEKLYHNPQKDKKQSGLICAGNQTHFIYSLDRGDLKTIENILESFKSNEIGILNLSEKGISFESNANAKNKQRIIYNYKNDAEWNYKENIGVLERIYIIGGGHVGLALARQMELLGFYIVVFDNRKNISTIKENIYADEIIISEFENIGNYIEEGEYSYIAIVTHSHQTDKSVLKQMLGKKVEYIGLMGSAAKLKRVLEELELEGVKQSVLNKIHAPIGIKIGSETVTEIAVSIAAEIIKIKNKAR